MASSFLATKLRIPPQPAAVVRRHRLIDALEHAIPQTRLVLLAAPAGYGKSTLLAQWASATRLPVVWLSLDAEDNDLERLLRDLLAAWDAVQPGIRESPLGLLLSAMSPDLDAVLAAVVNLAADQPDHLVVVLDDIDVLTDPAIHLALTSLLDRAPPSLHLVLAGRADPPLPLARYRARQQLREFRADDLQFRVDETAEFVNRRLGLALPQAEIGALQAHLEGWIAGLWLAALPLSRHQRPPDGLTVTGRQRFIADYLREEVLAPLPVATQRFLLQTSVLDRLCAPLCEAVTGQRQGQIMLETLERANLFLVPLDERREWFRYHRLVADFLSEELARRHPEEVPPLHRRAAHWYLAHDLPEPAFRHAMKGEDAALVAQLFERYAFRELSSGEFRVVRRWLDALPTEWYAAYPIVGLAQAATFLFTGQFDTCAYCLDAVEQRLMSTRSKDSRPQLGRVNAIRCYLACFQSDIERAETYANEALVELRDDDLSFRADIYQALGDTYRANGRWEEARAAYLRVLTFTQAPIFRTQSAHVFGALADLDLRRGQLRSAAAYWRRALSAIQDRANWGRLPLPLLGWVHIRLGELLYEWGERAEAWDHISRGLEPAELGGDIRTLIAGYVIAGRLKLADGDVDAATEYLERARPLVEQASFASWTGRFERLQVEIWLATDRVTTAGHWADQRLRDNPVQGLPDYEVTQLAIARGMIAQADAPSLGRALALLARLGQAAEAEGRMGIQIESLALQATAYWRRGERADALTALERALRLAEPEGYVRLFADLGLPIARLLQEARSRAVMPGYVARLLAAAGAGPAAPTLAEQPLPDRLTDREQEILELLAAGLTNHEIAVRLIISPETVKKHTGNIYAKLRVRGRTAAVARARALDLLP